jgi:hypothetical protein
LFDGLNDTLQALKEVASGGGGHRLEKLQKDLESAFDARPARSRRYSTGSAGSRPPQRTWRATSILEAKRSRSRRRDGGLTRWHGKPETPWKS